MMAATEQCFPRGGTERASKHTVFSDDFDPTFDSEKTASTKNRSSSSSLKKSASAVPKKKSHSVTSITKAKKFTKKQQSSTKKNGKRGESLMDSKIEGSTTVLFTPERLSTKKITKGTMLLAAVKEIRDYELRVNLANNVIGCVSITNMPDAYTSLLKRFAQSSDDQQVAEDLHSLDEIFTIGDIIPCVCIGEAGDNKLVQLSINPKTLHENLSPQCLHQDLVLHGSVSSIEDHGIHIDIGIANITAFMPTSITTDLYVGMVRRFRITESDVIGLISGDKRTVRVTLQTEEDKVERCWSDKDIQFNSILPGMLFTGRVHARKTEGLVVQVGQLKGYAHVSHLSQHVKDYPAGERAKFRVISVNATTKYIHLTALPSIVNDINKPSDGAVSIPLGEPVTVNVKRIVDKYAFLTTERDHASYMGVSLLPEKMRDSVKQTESKLKCFWFGWDYLEQRPVFSTVQPKVQKSVIPTLVAGDAVDVKLVSIKPEGAKACLSSGLHAFIQNIHLTEVPLKNPEKKLKVGQKLHCRILSVNLSTKRVRLTAKPSLVNSSLPVISDLQTVVVGSLVQGVIVKITTGALISFYSDVVGFVSSAHLAKETISHPADVFYIGQSVTCRVLSCDAGKDKMALTFILDGEEPRASKRKSGAQDEGQTKRQKRDSESTGVAMKVGQIIKGWSVVSEAKEGYEVASDEGHCALLPHSQLSDMPGISDIIAQSVKVDTPLDYLVCISGSRHRYTVSNKLLFKYYAAKEGLAQSWDNLKVGCVYPGYVKTKSVHGLFVCFGSDLVGLCPERLLSKDYASTLLPGRSVLAMVSSIDKQKKRMIVKLNPLECCLPTEDSDLLHMMLAKNLSDLNRYRGSKVTRYSIGEVVKGTILERDEDLIKLQLGDDIIAEASGEQTSGCTGRVGESVVAVVLYVDIINGKVAVLVDKGYVKDIKTSKSKAERKGDNNSSMVKVGQNIKSEIVYIRPEYILVLLRGHANGSIAFVPTLQHPNASSCTDNVVYAQQIKVCIKICESNGLVVGALQTEKERQSEKAEQLRAGKGLPQVGTIVDAVVVSKQDLQLNVKIGGTDGRVPVNELEKVSEYGLNPLYKYSEGQKLKVKILSTEIVVSNKKLHPVRGSDGKMVMLRCSVKECDPEWEADEEELSVNEHYTCYVTKHDTSNFSRMTHVITQDGKAAVISWHQLTQSGQSADDLVGKVPVGTCLYCKLVARGKDGTPYMQVVKPADEDDTEGKTSDTIYGMTASFSHISGLTVHTPIDPAATISLSEMAEPGVDIDPTLKSRGRVVRCRLVNKPADGHAVMTLRNKSGLIELNQLSVGMNIPAVVSSILPVSVVVMAAGHMINISLKPAELRIFKRSHKSGSACYITLTSVDKGSLEAVIKEALITDKKIPKSQGSTAQKKESTSPANSSSQAAEHLRDDAPAAGTKANTPAKKTKSDSKSKGAATKTEKEAAQNDSMAQQGSAVTKRKADAVVDTDTGVRVVFKHPRSSVQQKPTLDFGASIKSLQDQPRNDGNALEQKLSYLEEAGKAARREAPPTDQVDVISARKVKLAPVQLADESSQPQTEAEYLLVLKNSPNNAVVWSKLIAFTAAHKGVEAARARAEQALQTVSYRLEKEKLLIWSAFLRLEMVYGMEDSLDNVKRRAMQQMDELKVYRELVKLYVADGNNPQEAEQCYTMMLRKWSDNPTVWIEYGQFLYNQKKREAGRTLLQRCLKTLSTKQHIEVIMKFAVMEIKDGDFERFTSLFENVISNFPKRNDVWSVYIDQLIKSEKYDNARAVLRRAIMQKWNAKKIQFFVSKFTEFETQHGTEDSLNEANQLIQTL